LEPVTNTAAEAKGEPATGRPWLVTAGALGLYLVGTQVPLPGLEPGVRVAPSAAPSGLLGLLGYHPPLVAVLGVGLGWLVLVRGALALLLGDATRSATTAAGSRWRLAGLVAYLIAASGQAVVLLRYLEQAVGPEGLPLLSEPGWAYRLSAFATLVGGAAVLWTLATWITREGVGHGTLLLLGVTSLVGGANGLYLAGQQLASGAGDWGLGLGAWLWSLPIATAALALWRWQPAQWPVALPPLRASLGCVDLLAAPAAVAAVLAMPVMAVVGLLWVIAPEAIAALGRLHYWLAFLHPLVTLAAVLGLVVWWRQQGHAGRGHGGWLALTIGVPVLAAALIVVGLAAAGGGPRSNGPSPYAGQTSFEVVLESAQGGGAHDAKVLLQRLDELGVEAELREAGEQRIVLRLHAVSDEASVMAAAFPQGRLGFHLVALDQEALRPRPGEPPPAGLVVGNESGAEIFLGPSPESLTPLLERAARSAGRIARIECRPDQGGRQWPVSPRPAPGPPQERRECLVRLLEEPAVLTGDDVADASVTLDPMTGRPTVSLGFSPEAGQRFAQITGAAIGRLLAIVLDDRIESAPLIQSPIAGGRAVITLGASSTHDAVELRRQAEGLVAALRHGALQGRWTKTSVRQL
jgi:hypothetical protein